MSSTTTRRNFEPHYRITEDQVVSQFPMTLMELVGKLDKIEAAIRREAKDNSRSSRFSDTLLSYAGQISKISAAARSSVDLTCHVERLPASIDGIPYKTPAEWANLVGGRFRMAHEFSKIPQHTDYAEKVRKSIEAELVVVKTKADSK